MTCQHCKTPIAEHPAGRCLDALVAEKVMGWRRLDKPIPAGQFYGTYTWVKPGGARETDADVPAYSTDPAAMVELWTKLREKGGASLVACSGLVKPSKACRAHVIGDKDLYCAEAPTPMLALARAAVLARVAVLATEGGGE